MKKYDFLYKNPHSYPQMWGLLVCVTLGRYAPPTVHVVRLLDTELLLHEAWQIIASLPIYKAICNQDHLSWPYLCINFGQGQPHWIALRWHFQRLVFGNRTQGSARDTKARRPVCSAFSFASSAASSFTASNTPPTNASRHDTRVRKRHQGQCRCQQGPKLERCVKRGSTLEPNSYNI